MIVIFLQVKYGGSFDAARKHCQEYGGDLIQTLNYGINQKYISSELERLRESMTTTMLWTGAVKDPSYISRSWRWLNGSIMFLSYAVSNTEILVKISCFQETVNF